MKLALFRKRARCAPVTESLETYQPLDGHSDFYPLQRVHAASPGSEHSADLEAKSGACCLAWTIESQPSRSSIHSLRSAVDAYVETSGSDSVYQRKAVVMNKAIQEIGTGRYQWALFVLCGFGWLADSLWLQGVALTLPQLVVEFDVDENQVRYTTCALFIGLCIGASFWSTASDLVGRKPVFNCTLALASVFGVVSGFSSTWAVLCTMYAMIGVGIGGNLPVDGSLFLESLPVASGGMLTLLSVWWAVGQLVASFVAWALIPKYSCSLPCSPSDNMGWRYMLYALGGITCLMFAARTLCFRVLESPKSLLARGQQTAAVQAVHGMACHNGKKTWLSEAVLDELGGRASTAVDTNSNKQSLRTALLGKVSGFSLSRLRPLFSSRGLGLMTVLVWLTWLTFGLAFPLFNAFLPQYLSMSSSNPYTAYLIASAASVPGSLGAWYLADRPGVGRKGVICASTLATGGLVCGFALAKADAARVALAALAAAVQTAAYAVLYCLTPEVFPATARGTATGVASLLNRLAGLAAPFVAIGLGRVDPLAPVYAAAGLFLLAFCAQCAFPLETRGRQTL